MKQWGREILTVLILGLVIPAAAFRIGTDLPQNDTQQQTLPPETQERLQPEGSSGLLLSVREEDAVREMDAEAYLLGAVLGEMPASFEVEALKAQAVAARTYALKALVTGGKHGDGSVCTDFACCQAYIDPEEYLNRGGTAQSVEKVRSAVCATTGMVLTYEDKLIEATYFSCSGGRTEDAQAVWGADYPYLKAVDSPGEEHAAYFSDRVTFTLEQFCSVLGLRIPDGPLSVEKWEMTAGNGVKTVYIGGVCFEGTTLRRLLGLRSTTFAITQGDGTVTVTTRGYGHRVGMSQYGADAMAVDGKDYIQILNHYYPGTELICWTQ